MEDHEERRRFGSIVNGIGKRIATGKPRHKDSGSLYKRTIDAACASNGHAYRIHDTAWRCGMCGNHVARRDGELYGLVADGRTERRRQAR